MLRFYPLIHILAKIAEGPAVETTIRHGCHVVRHQITAEQVALIDGDPEPAAFRLPGHTHRIAQASGKFAVLTGFGVNFPNGRAAFLLLKTIFADVTVGAHTDVKLAAIRAGNHAFGPVMVDFSGWQVGDFGALGGDTLSLIHISEPTRRTPISY